MIFLRGRRSSAAEESEPKFQRDAFSVNRAACRIQKEGRDVRKRCSETFDQSVALVLDLARSSESQVAQDWYGRAPPLNRVLEEERPDDRR